MHNIDTYKSELLKKIRKSWIRIALAVVLAIILAPILERLLVGNKIVSQGYFPFVILLLIVPIFVLGYSTRNIRCPKCGNFFFRGYFSRSLSELKRPAGELECASCNHKVRITLKELFLGPGSHID